MIIDNKGRIAGKLSIVDLAALLLVLVLFAGAYYKFFVVGDGIKKGDISQSKDKIQYRVQIKDIRQPSVDALQSVDKVFDDKENKFLGTIVKREVTPSTDLISRVDGTIVEAVRPDKFDEVLTINVDGKVTDVSFLAGGDQEIKAGKNITLRSKLITVITTVMDVKKID